MPRHCLTLDLRDDPAAIAEYTRHHQRIWPEVRDSLFEAGVLDMEIYLLGTRMFMIMKVAEDFSFEHKAALDFSNPKVQEWEQLMRQFQQQLPQAPPGEWWLPMRKVFSLAAQGQLEPARKPSTSRENGERLR